MFEKLSLRLEAELVVTAGRFVVVAADDMLVEIAIEPGFADFESEHLPALVDSV